jgi:hypothetical protein
MSSKQQSFLGGAVVHKELQGFAAFVAYQQGCHQGGGTNTKAMLEASIGLQFFCDAKDPDSIGLAEQLVLGVGVFQSLYENSGTLGLTTPLRHNADAYQPSSTVSRPPLTQFPKSGFVNPSLSVDRFYVNSVGNCR